MKCSSRRLEFYAAGSQKIPPGTNTTNLAGKNCPISYRPGRKVWSIAESILSFSLPDIFFVLVLSVDGGFLAKLDGELRAAVQAPEAQRAVLLGPYRMLIYHLDGSRRAFPCYYTLLKYKIDHPEYLLQREIITALLQAIIIDFCAFFLGKTIEDTPADTLDNAEKAYNKFMVLLSRTTVKKRSVGYYAQQLCITPKYLSKLCKQASGKSAHEWIEEAVREDIKHALKDPDRTIKEIVADLGFGTSSFFGKYVKDRFGLTPVQLRGQLLSEEA